LQVLDEALDAPCASRTVHRRAPVARQGRELIDTAAARVAVSQHAVPPEVDDCRRRIQALRRKLGILGRETPPPRHQARQTEINEKLAKEKENARRLEKHWNEEKELVGKILDLRAKLRAAGSTIEAQPTR